MTAQNSWKTLRQNAPLLSYSLLFQPPKDRACLADLFSLGLEFDFILAQASEPMLALIRLKWWEEQIDNNSTGSLPLLDRIHAHIAAERLKNRISLPYCPAGRILPKLASKDMKKASIAGQNY